MNRQLSQLLKPLLDSTDYSQQARLSGAAGVARWSVVIAGVLVHLNGLPAQVASSVAEFDVVYKF